MTGVDSGASWGAMPGGRFAAVTKLARPVRFNALRMAGVGSGALGRDAGWLPYRSIFQNFHAEG